ncbi:hypothetical protein C0W57_07385 [Bacillus velezensis]|nr:hypothetical protein C0W57_07385 [Bacillus velezensis]
MRVILRLKKEVGKWDRCYTTLDGELNRNIIKGGEYNASSFIRIWKRSIKKRGDRPLLINEIGHSYFV